MAIYLDVNATTRIAGECLDIMNQSAIVAWQNPSSSYGRSARDVIDHARAAVAKVLNVSSHDILFTSGGTEANHLVFYTFTSTKRCPIKPHIVTTCIEHPSVLRPLQALEANGDIDLTTVPVDKEFGNVNPDDVISTLRPNQTVLVSIMAANNETGAILPLKAIVDKVRQWERSCRPGPLLGRIYVHSDMAQLIGKLPVDLSGLDVDYVTVVGHKFYGPRIGCLYVRDLQKHSKPNTSLSSKPSPDLKGAPLCPLFLGGNQEFGLRAGTENTPMIAALGKACELVTCNLRVYTGKMLDCRKHLEFRLKEAFPVGGQPFVCIFGLDRYSDPVDRHNSNGNDVHASIAEQTCTNRLPNTVHLVFVGPPWLNSQDILQFCPNLQASRGAACHSSEKASNQVLEAYGYSPQEIASAIRLSVGRDTTIEEIDLAVGMLRSAVDKMLA